MNTQTQTTPLPWEISHQLGDGFSIAHEIAPNCGRLVCVATFHNVGGWQGARLDDATAKANRDFALLAVNSHTKLLLALENTLKWQGIFAAAHHGTKFAKDDYDKATADFNKARHIYAEVLGEKQS